jgi:hypothetical protein
MRHFLNAIKRLRHAERLRRNLERVLREGKLPIAFPANAGIHSSTDTCAASDREALPTGEQFVRRNNGPRLFHPNR